jgi:iron complex outermembrane receptor protein
LAATQRHGVEIESRWEPTKYLSFSGAMSWIKEFNNPNLSNNTSTNIATAAPYFPATAGYNPLYYAGGKYAVYFPAGAATSYVAAPQRQINFFGDYIFGHTGFDVSGGVSHTDGYWADNLNDIYLPSVTQFSADIGYHTKKHWEFRASGANLTNKIGFYPTNGAGAIIPMPGRIETFKVTYKY